MILSKDEYFNRIKSVFGDSDEDLKNIEDLTDTYNSLSEAAESAESVDIDAAVSEAVKRKDTEWRTRYRERFFNESADEKDFSKAVERQSRETLTLSDIFND